MATLIGWIVRAVVFGTIVMYGAMGEILTEKAGHLNLGTPGIMCIGGAFGFAGAYAYENAVYQLYVCAFLILSQEIRTHFYVQSLQWELHLSQVPLPAQFIPFLPQHFW